MTRLDELYELRRAIDLEIERETETLRAIAEIRDQVAETLATARTATHRTLLAAAETQSVTVDDLVSTSRRRAVTDGRHLAAAVLHALGETYADIGRVFGQDHTTAMNAVSRVTQTPRLAALRDQILTDLRTTTVRSTDRKAS